MKKSLYKDCEKYKVYKFKDTDEWAEARAIGIGGSEAAAAMGMSRWTTMRDLWAYKTGRERAPDISDSPYVIYGVRHEPLIRNEFAEDYRDVYEVQYSADTLLQSVDHPHMIYSPDGLLLEKETGRRGILEIKTHAITTSNDLRKWKDGIGNDEYFIQVLHGLGVTGFEFVCLRAELRWSLEEKITRTYIINRTDETIEEQIAVIEDTCEQFWNEYIEEGKEPPVITYLQGGNDY